MSSPGPRVRTVCGDIEPADLGALNYHEHLFQVSPLLVGDEITDPVRSAAEAASLVESGFDSMIDATPVGLGRDPRNLASIAAEVGLGIVATSGAHRRQHYPDDHWVRGASAEELAAIFRRDVLDGMPCADEVEDSTPAFGPGGEPVRAGLLKAGIGYWEIDPFSRRVIEAIGIVHRSAPVPVMIHLEHGSATHEVLDVLQDEGIAASSVILAHIDRNPDPVLHAELASRGAYLGYDGFARHRDYPDSILLDTLVAAAERGAAQHLLIGGDVARATRYLAYGGMPGLSYVGRRVLPRLRALDAVLTDLVTIANPRRALAWQVPA